MTWLKFIAIQIVMLLATVCGWFILLPFCLARAWCTYAMIDDRGFCQHKSIKDGRVIDAWDMEWLNAVYGNPEDGVSGQTARVWLNGDTQGPYMPGAWAPWRAYCWSAWRNSADNLKYVFAGEPGVSLPLVTFKLFGRTARLGWQQENGYNVPVFSL